MLQENKFSIPNFPHESIIVDLDARLNLEEHKLIKLMIPAKDPLTFWTLLIRPRLYISTVDLNVITDGFVFFVLFVWQKLSQKKFIILCDKYGNIGNQLYMSCFMIKWAEQFGALTFNFGLIHNQQYFTKTSTDIFLRYPYRKSFNSPKLQEILATSVNRISLRLLNFKLWKNIKSLDLLQNKTEKDFHEVEATIQNSDIILLRGFIHNQPYSIFRKVFPKIKEYFEVSSRYHSKINEPLENLKRLRCNRGSSHKAWGLQNLAKWKILSFHC